MHPAKTSAPRVDDRNQFLEIRHSRATFKDFEKDYFVVKFKRRAGVVAIQDGRVLLTQQYRFLLNGPSWELPGGSVEDEEPIESGLRRECLEETGVELRTISPLVQYYPGLDNVDNETTLFLCRDPQVIRAFTADPAEITAIAWFDVERCLEMIFQREILDAMTTIGLLAYVHRSSGLTPAPERTETQK
jgi:8-oxo-dGTP pyrophosphatase MutT (NUDIX family)